MNRRAFVLLAMCGLLLSVGKAAAQRAYPQFYFTHIDDRDGLSANNVKAIMQDSYGFMWFGTKNGLNRYDGTSILQLNVDDIEAGVGNHNIGALCEDEQKNIWVGTDRGIYIYNPATDIFKHFDLRSDGGITPENWVAKILSDSAGNIWSLIPDQGVFRFDVKRQKLSHYAITDPRNFKIENPSCIAVDRNSDIWIGASRVGIYKYDTANDSFEKHLRGGNEEAFRDKNITGISFLGDEMVVAVYEGELIKYDTRTREISEMDFPGRHKTFLSEVLCMGDDIWVGSHSGLFIVNEKNGTTMHLREDPMQSFSLSDNNIYSIYRDNNGGVWAGTMFGGVNYLPKQRLSFDRYVPASSGHSINTKRVRGLAQDESGQIWIGTEDGGVNVLDPHTGRVHQVHDNVPGHLISLFVEHYNGKIYTGLVRDGLNRITLPGERIEHLTSQDLGIEEGSVYDFMIDSKGRQWIGTEWGLYMKRPGQTKFSRLDPVGYNWIFRIMEDGDGTIWIATMGNGVWKCDIESGTFRNYVMQHGKEDTLSSNSVSSIMQDSRGAVWFSTDRGGVCRYNSDTDNFTAFGIGQGLPDDVCYDILEDDNSNLWFGTNKGLVRMDPETGKIDVFTDNDGLPGNQFNYGSALRARDGRFFFGGVDGLIAFDPLTLRYDAPNPPVYISKLSVDNREVTVHTPDSPLTRSIIHTESIRLPHDSSNIGFEVAVLNYTIARSNRFYYRMVPLDRKWIEAGGNQNISYAKLPAGKYTFQIKAAEGDASIRQLSVVVLPPWWLSWWAYLLYLLVALTIVIICFRWYRYRKEQQIAERQKVFEIGKEKELYESKVRFFSEIAHEIRTPLTLINGPLEAIGEEELPEDKQKKYIGVMQQNVRRLLELTGQLLDFQKIGAEKLSMKFASVDIVELLQGVAARFEIAFSLIEKQLELKLHDEYMCAAVDRDAIVKIISNLLDNALKYADKRVCVELTGGETSFTVKVSSDGNKIPPEEGRYIFEPFYQMEKNGTPRKGVGIGLSLSRSLASLHNGTLSLDTSHERDNVFVLEIPLNEDGIDPDNGRMPETDIIDVDSETSVTADRHGYTVLLVEDNEEMLAFISERLQASFLVETARNGAQALEVLSGNHVDLIVSDIVMPVMDGYQLCRAVKQNADLSFIPVILLTAKNDVDSKVKGLKYGAEAYVEKPFSFSYLKEQIQSLLDNRSREREAFAKHPFFSLSSMQINKADEEFMNRAIRLIEENITDENFSVELMASSLCMSRSSLQRRIKTVVGMSPLDFIRLIRLKKAAEYIREGKYRIGDVCCMVGINSPAYFSKLFMKQFGMLPKDFEKERSSNSANGPTKYL